MHISVANARASALELHSFVGIVAVNALLVANVLGMLSVGALEGIEERPLCAQVSLDIIGASCWVRLSMVIFFVTRDVVTSFIVNKGALASLCVVAVDALEASFISTTEA